MSASSCKRRRGFILVLGVIFVLLLIIPAAGLTIDVGKLYLAQARLSAAVDFATIAGARALSRGSDDASQRANAVDTANAFFHTNFVTGYLGTTNLQVATTATTDSTYLRSITTTASVDVPYTFMRVFHLTSVTLNSTAKATRRDINIMIIMDRSTSLTNSGSCGPLKTAAANFVGKFAEGRDNVGLLTFATSSRVDYPLSQTFKTSIQTTLNNLVCTGGTSSAQALWQGYRELVRLGQAGALNAIVFFTDGRPTAITEAFPIKSGSSCTSKTPKTGVLTSSYAGTTPQNPYGLFLQDAPAQPTSSDLTLISSHAGCRFYTQGATSVASDVNYAPALDIWGNSVVATAYRSVTASSSGYSVSSAQNIENMSVNAADHAGLRVRRGDPDPTQGNKTLAGVVIYSIGLGDVDDVLLKRIANDPSLTPNPVATGNTGRSIYAQNSTDLDLAFTRVASELLRLAK